MKLGDIKIEAMKLMFVNYNIDFQIEQLEQLAQDENYGSYLVNMPGAINRCFSSLEEKGVLPVKPYVLSPSEALASGSFLRFDLASLIDDFFDIERVVYENDNGEYIGDYEYRREGNVIVLANIGEGERYTVLYKPKLERITASTENTYEIPIPDNIASHIPYFIKGDLYRDDEPNEASEARNWYEAAMEGITESKVNKVNKVQSIYSQTET